MNTPLPRTTRLRLALIFGVASGLICWGYRLSVEGGAGDFTWILHAAEDLLSGRDPYANVSLGSPFFGWVGYRVWFPNELHGELITTVCFYLPMLIMLLRRGIDVPQIHQLLVRLRARLPRLGRHI
ncbi:hypothetical protein K2Z83_15045 [Oscillochloris sp. ZM17-4]|uniref:hypothetical protein n=1 Tax=Oscillochloris sp. ZM17-4 TaxID=2866714 RepID=UPI001C73B3E9|nr:hypothetical protein [Oscillochloris sp. ZM17-4]MBX0328993.1 hypothetical protein [Oscillochloris sp. ZM17-4]